MAITPIVYREGLGRKLTIAEMDGNFQYLEDNIAIVPNIIWFLKTGLTFTIRAKLYPLQNVAYSAPETDITLDTADGTFDRIDLIFATNTNTVSKRTGVADGSLDPPTYDILTEYPIVFIKVENGATTPGTITVVDIYKENTEWATTENTSGARINLASTSDPFAGTKCIEATSIFNGDVFRLTPSSPVDTADITVLLFRLKMKAAFANPGRIDLRFYNSSGVAVSNIVSIKDGDYGYDNTDTTNYQLISIPSAAFGFTASQITYLEIWQYKPMIGWRIDDIQYQKGISGVSGDFLPTGGYAGTAADLKTLIDAKPLSTKEQFTATASQTVFNLSSTPNNVDVFRGRNYMLESEYTLNGNTITTSTGMPAGTKITVRKY